MLLVELVALKQQQICIKCLNVVFLFLSFTGLIVANNVLLDSIKVIFDAKRLFCNYKRVIACSVKLIVSPDTRFSWKWRSGCWNTLSTAPPTPLAAPPTGAGTPFPTVGWSLHVDCRRGTTGRGVCTSYNIFSLK